MFRYLPLFLLSIISSFSQDLAPATDFFNDEKAVYLEKSQATTVTLENDKPKIVTTYLFKKKIVDNDAQAYANHTIHHSATWNKILTVEAYILRRDAKKKKKKFHIPATNIKTSSSLSSSIFFDDNKETDITFPKVYKDDEIIITYTEELTDPHLMSGFYFTSYIPSYLSSYSISVTKGVTIGHKIINGNDNISFEKKEKEGVTTYTWKAENITDYHLVSNGPNFRYYEPHLVSYIKNYTANGKEVEVSGTVSNLFNWYSSLVDPVNQTPSIQLQSITDSITAYTSTDIEKAKAIFYWVQNNIKYVAFENGLGGFVPREANAVCTKRYGDCKDMSSILTEMLKYAGIEAYLTWIGSRDIPYSYTEVPTPQVDNHMIATVKINDQFYFLDATSSYSKFGNPTSFIQGKEALLRISNGEYKILKVPFIAASENKKIDKVALSIKDSKLIGQGKLSYHDLLKIPLTWRINGKTPQEEKEYLEAILEKGNNKFILKDFSTSGLEKFDAPLTINYSFDIADYLTSYKDEIYVNLNLNQTWKSSQIDIEDRKEISVEFDNHSTFLNVFSLTIPEGYTVDYLPESVNFENDQFSIHFNYLQKENTVTLKQSFNINTTLVTKAYFSDWNTMIKQLNDAYQETIVLKKS